MNSRLKMLRQELRLSQEEFANRIGFTRGAVANAELGRAEIRPHFITLVCNTFDVNEHWLRTGEGEMFNELSREEELTRFFAKTLRNPESKTMRALIYTLAQLPDEALDAWADFAIQFCEALQKEKSGQPPDSD